MAIPEEQLKTWARQGPTKQFTDTYESISTVLNDKDSPFAHRSFKFRLQGSYANDTNVYGDSDVDVVIFTSDTFHYDVEHLTAEEKLKLANTTPDVPSACPGFKKEVISWLNTKYGPQNVDPGRKAILLKGNDSRRDADILVATEHRQYYRFESHAAELHNAGIRFFAADGTSIVNFPEQHSANCTGKHQATRERFKPTVRIFKNMRNRLVDRSELADGMAPSYYIEGMLWNVPDHLYASTHSETFTTAINWLLKAKRDDLLCANQRRWLLRDGKPDSWKPADFETSLKAVAKQWDDWGK